MKRFSFLKIHEFYWVNPKIKYIIGVDEWSWFDQVSVVMLHLSSFDFIASNILFETNSTNYEDWENLGKKYL